jgi:O-antigen/teichoic acid export membrane protein
MTETAALPRPAAVDDRPELRDQVVGGFGWTMLASGTMQISRMIVAVALARLLTPADYGLAAMALVFSSLVLTISDVSLGAGLVQRREITEADRSTVFWTSAAIGLTLTVIGVAVSWPLAAFYGRPQVQPLFAVLSLSFLLVSLQITQASVLQREMKFRVLNLRITAATACGGAVGIGIAIAGGGAWALIGQQMTVALTSTVLLWRYSTWRPRFMYSTRSLRGLGSFGLNVFGARILDYLNRNADNLLVGRFLGAPALGAYSVAYNLMTMPLERIVYPLQDALFPAYSRWQDDREKLGSVWVRVVAMLCAVIAPCLLGLAVVAPDFVRVVLGSRWLPSATVLRVLAGIGLLQCLAIPGRMVLQATNRTRSLLWLALIEVAVTLPAFVLGLRWGIVGVAVCYSIATVPIQGLLLRLTLRTLGVRLSKLASAVSGPLEAGVAMAGCCYGAQLALERTGAGAGIDLAATIAVGAAVYIPLLRWRAADITADATRVILRKLRPSGSVSGAPAPVTGT